MKNFKKILLTSVFASAMLLGAMMVFVPVTAVAADTVGPYVMNKLWNRQSGNDYACYESTQPDCYDEIVIYPTD